MKKTLIALAAASLACAASAQSSVSLFGVIDTGYTYGKGSLSSRSRLTSSNWQSSRLGFRGTEDLGGGLRAGFWLEGALNTDDGSGGATNTNNQTTGAGTAASGTQGLTFGRASWVSLAGSFGDIHLGRDFAPHHLNYTYMDPWQTVGIAGSAAHMGRASAQAGWGSFTNTAGVRVSNQIEYRSPAWGGPFVHYSHILGENVSGTATSHDGTGDSVRFGYAGRALTVALSYGHVDFSQTATQGDTTFKNLGVAYQFGFAQVSALLARDSFDTTVPFHIDGWELGAIVPWGANEIRAAISGSEKTTPGNSAKPSIRKLGLGIGHNFSKRTNVYLNAAYLQNRGGSAAALGAATTAPNEGSRGIDIGIRHSF